MSDAEFEVTDLAAPPNGAGQAIPTGDAPPSRRFFRAPPRWLISALVVVALLAGAAYGLAPAPAPAPRIITAPPPNAAALGLAPVARGLTAVNAAAWSRDGHDLAVLGQDVTHADRLLLYHLAAPVITFQSTWFLDPLIVASARARLPGVILPGDHPTTGQVGALIVHQPAWSADGQMVDVPFTLVRVTPQPGGGAFTSQGRGVIILTVGPPSARVVLAAGGATAEPILWNLTTGTLVTDTVPLALAYQWGAGDVPIPLTALSGPVGDPNGGAQFTLWQPGWLTTTVTGTEATPLGFALYSVDVTAVAPDGQALAVFADDLRDFAARLIITTSGQTVSAPYQLTPALLTPPHDAALSVLLAERVGATHIAWSPDGATLAVFNGANYPPAVDLLATATGKTVARVFLSVTFPPGNGPTGPPVLRWTPDGRGLLVIDLNVGLATVAPIATADLGSATLSH